MKKLYILIPVLFVLFSADVKAQLTICTGEQTCLVSSAFTGSIQWQSSADLVSWTDIPSATTDTFCFSFSATGYYRAMITNGTCNPIYSDTTLLTAFVPGTGVDTFFFTGSMEQFIVPTCVDSVTITCYGAQGGEVTGQSPYPQGGLGAIMQGRFDVTSGQILNVMVGGRGNPDPSSSGGGGGSGVAADSVLWIIAGGGAGVDFQDPNYPGQHATTSNDGIIGNGIGGAGGTGGADGVDNIYSGSNISRGGRGWNSGYTGSTGQDGISPNTTYTAGSFGLGGGGGSVGYGWCNCGGGGGGYSGGGSGNINQTGGGGGSYNIGNNQNNTGGVHTGNGMVIITW